MLNAGIEGRTSVVELINSRGGGERQEPWRAAALCRRSSLQRGGGHCGERGEVKEYQGKCRWERKKQCEGMEEEGGEC